MPLDASFPKWLLEKKWHEDQRSAEVGNQALRAIQIGSEMAQRNQQLAMQASRQIVQDEQAKAQTALHILDAKIKQGEADDMVKLYAAQAAYSEGNRGIVPQLKTSRAMKAWEDFTLMHDGEEGERAEWVGFLNDYNRLDGFGKSSVRSGGQEWPPSKGGITPDHYRLLGEAQAKQRDELLQAKGATEVVEIDGRRYIKPVGGMSLHPVPPNFGGGVEAVEIKHPQTGEVLGYGLPNTGGGVSPLRSPPQPTRHPLQTTLAKAEADLKAAQVDPARKTELPALLEKVKSLKRSIEADTPQSQEPQPPRIRRYNPATGGLSP